MKLKSVLFLLILIGGDFFLTAPALYPKKRSLIEELSRKEKIQHVKKYLDLGLDFYSSGSYEEAMAFFYSAVKYRELSYLPEYREAMYYLGESYFQSGMLQQAYQTYRKILAIYGREFPFYPDVIQRLLEISIMLKRFGEAIGYFKILKEILPPEAFENRALYLLGVSYFNMRKYREAAKLFRNIKKGGEFYLQSRYYLASIYLLENQPVKSYRIFYHLLKEVKSDLAKTPLEETGKRKFYTDFKDLLLLSIGRLFFEAGDYDRARSYYLKITSTSRFYDHALYERAWVWAMKRQFGKTYHLLYQLAEEVPDSPLIPKAQLLYGYCYIEENRSREAEREFKNYLLKYGSIEEKLKKFLQSHRDLHNFYEEILVKSETALTGLPVPVDVLLRLKKSRRVRKSEELYEKISRMQKDLEDISKRLEEVKLIAEKSGRQAIIPGTIFSHNKIKQILYTMRMIELKLLQYKKAEIINAVSLEGAKVLGEVYELRRLTSYLMDVLEELRKKVAEKRNELLSILDFLTGVLPPDVISKYAAGITTGITPEQKRYLAAKAELERELKQLENMNPLIDFYENRVASMREMTFTIEKRIMDHFARRIRYQRKKYLKKIDALLKKIEYLRNQINVIRQEMVRKKLQAIARVRKEITEKEKILAQYIKALGRLKREADQMRGKVVYAELENFRKMMDFYTMQAHMGFIDISWKIKEENEKKVNNLYEAEADEISRAENYYSNLLAEARKKPEVKLKLGEGVNLKPVSVDELDKLEENLDLKDSLYGFDFRDVGKKVASVEQKVDSYSRVITTLKESPFNPLKPVKLKAGKKENVYLRLRIRDRMGWQYRLQKVEAFIDGFLLFQNDRVQDLPNAKNFIGFAGMILPGEHHLELKFYYKTRGFLFWKPARKNLIVRESYDFDCAPHDNVFITFSIEKEKGAPEVIEAFKRKKASVKEGKK